MEDKYYLYHKTKQICFFTLDKQDITSCIINKANINYLPIPLKRILHNKDEFVSIENDKSIILNDEGLILLDCWLSDREIPVNRDNYNKYIKKNKIDVVHCNSFNAPELLILSKIVNHNCKVVSTIHGMGQFENIGKNKIFLKNWICDKFIGISNAVVEDIVAAGIDEKKVARVYNGIETKKYNCAKLKKYDENAIVIGCVARIMPELKGQDVLLEAIKIVKKQHTKVIALFAGGVAENQQSDYEYLKKYVRDNSLEENVKFLGSLDNIPEFLNKIDICVVPSRSEGFGLALVEAMAMGVPCVASNIAGPREIIKKTDLGMLFESNNSVDLASKLENMIVDFVNEFKSVKL